MISLYSGTPGSGKSLHVAADIYWRLRTGRPVVANFDIAEGTRGRDENFAFVRNEDLSPKLLADFARRYFEVRGKKVREGELLLVIDEAQLIFNSRDWNTPGRREWLSWFTQHRKLGYDVVLVAQNDGMLDKQIRALIEYNVVHRKVNNYGMFGRLVGLFSAGRAVIVSVRYWYAQKARISSEWTVGLKRYFSIYDTYNTFE